MCKETICNLSPEEFACGFLEGKTKVLTEVSGTLKQEKRFKRHCGNCQGSLASNYQSKFSRLDSRGHSWVFIGQNDSEGEKS